MICPTTHPFCLSTYPMMAYSVMFTLNPCVFTEAHPIVVYWVSFLLYLYSINSLFSPLPLHFIRYIKCLCTLVIVSDFDTPQIHFYMILKSSDNLNTSYPKTGRFLINFTISLSSILLREDLCILLSIIWFDYILLLSLTLF